MIILPLTIYLEVFCYSLCVMKQFSQWKCGKYMTIKVAQKCENIWIFLLNNLNFVTSIKLVFILYSYWYKIWIVWQCTINQYKRSKHRNSRYDVSNSTIDVCEAFTSLSGEKKISNKDWQKVRMKQGGYRWK